MAKYSLIVYHAAPQECPLQDQNVMRTVLFVEDDAECLDICSQELTCLYYYFYPGMGADSFSAVEQPSQCFLYEECSRQVFPAPDNCPINRYVKVVLVQGADLAQILGDIQ